MGVIAACKKNHLVNHLLSRGPTAALTFDVLEQPLGREQGEAHRLQHLHHVLASQGHVLVHPLHGGGEHLVLVLDAELLAPQHPHQLVLGQAPELIDHTHLGEARWGGGEEVMVEGGELMEIVVVVVVVVVDENVILLMCRQRSD